ncbi:MAG: helix-hairpin-helix domain-containing protein [Thermoplasmata archaeon]
MRAVQQAPRPQLAAVAEAATEGPSEAEVGVPEEVAVEETIPELDREEALQEFAELPGIGPATAEALWEAGFTSIAKLQEANAEELAQVKGLGPASAKKIVAHLKEGAA